MPNHVQINILYTSFEKGIKSVRPGGLLLLPGAQTCIKTAKYNLIN